MGIFCATYQYGDDEQARAALDAGRPAHRDWLAAQPSLLASGPTDANGAVLIFEGDSAEQVEQLLEQDPIAGVVIARRVVGWQVVRGRWLELINEQI